MTDAPKRGGFIREFGTGVGFLFRGFGFYGRDPGMMLFGLIPAVITFVLLVVGFGFLIYFIDDVASLVTWFADGWSAAGRDSVRVIAGVSIIGLALLLAIVTFTSLTLAIGDPFYEKISERVEDRLGGVPEAVPLGFWTEMWRGIRESIRLLTVSAMVGIPLFLLGFLPVVGQTVIPVIGALFGGWFLAIELVGVPFTRRGLRLADRRRVLRANRPLAVGFGAAVFACFLIPLGAIFVMPAAVAGGAMLARRVLGADTGNF